jgi:hypothetical protein
MMILNDDGREPMFDGVLNQIPRIELPRNQGGTRMNVGVHKTFQQIA